MFGNGDINVNQHLAGRLGTTTAQRVEWGMVVEYHNKDTCHLIKKISQRSGVSVQAMKAQLRSDIVANCQVLVF